MTLTLYGYWRSSAAYRVRIALNLKGLAWESRPVHLLKQGGEQHRAEYRAHNPQELVPCLLDGEQTITQSMAIVEYLEETRPTPPLLPVEAMARARVRALAQAVACDIHPLNNLRVLQYLENPLGIDEDRRELWVRHWIALGFAALETMLAGNPETGLCCHGDEPTLADVCLIPQVYNALRFHLPLESYPTIQRIHAHCNTLEAFQASAPERQSDAP